MADLASSIVAVAQAHALLAYALSFFLAGAEAFPIVGAVVPGTAVILAMGALVPSGALRLWPLVVATTGGAIAGDGLSYWLGHHFKLDAARVWPLRRHPELVERGRAAFARHGGKAVLIARFTPGVRAVVPVVAGISGMPPGRFYLMNVVSAAVWAPSHILLGTLLGASIAVLGAIAGRLAALAAAVLLALALLVWLTPKAVRWLARRAIRWREPVQAWAASRDTWLRRSILSLLDPRRPELPGLMVLSGLIVAGLWLFLGILEDVVTGDPLVRADHAVYRLLQGLRIEPVDGAMVAITELGDTVVVLSVAVAILTWLLWHRAWRAALYGTAAVLGAALWAILLKATLERARPEALYAGWSSYSFPSSHATVNVVLYGFLAVLIGREVQMRWRIGTVLAATLLVTAIAFSRLYLGAHWLSDVAAGLAFGTAWISILGIGYLRHGRREVRAGALAGVAVVALLVAGTVHVTQVHGSDMRRYAVVEPVRQMTLYDWRQGGWTSLPVRRTDLLGTYEEPITLQWAGPVSQLKAALTADGWTAPPPWTPASILQWIAPHPRPASLPVLPHLERGRLERLVMIRTGAGLDSRDRLVLRLWRSDVALSNVAGGQPVWVGAAAMERIAPTLSLVSHAEETPGVNTAIQKLRDALPSARMKRRPEGAMSRGWDGSVLLAVPLEQNGALIQPHSNSHYGSGRACMLCGLTCGPPSKGRSTL